MYSHCQTSVLITFGLMETES